MQICKCNTRVLQHELPVWSPGLKYNIIVINNFSKCQCSVLQQYNTSGPVLKWLPWKLLHYSLVLFTKSDPHINNIIHLSYRLGNHVPILSSCQDKLGFKIPRHFHDVVHISFFKSQTMQSLTFFIEKIIYVYNTKCIPYESIHHNESNGIDLVF
jgi:hypothetical protein